MRPACGRERGVGWVGGRSSEVGGRLSHCQSLPSRIVRNPPSQPRNCHPARRTQREQRHALQALGQHEGVGREAAAHAAGRAAHVQHAVLPQAGHQPLLDGCKQMHGRGKGRGKAQRLEGKNTDWRAPGRHCVKRDVMAAARWLFKSARSNTPSSPAPPSAIHQQLHHPAPPQGRALRAHPTARRPAWPRRSAPRCACPAAPPWRPRPPSCTGRSALLERGRGAVARQEWGHVRHIVYDRSAHSPRL